MNLFQPPTTSSEAAPLLTPSREAATAASDDGARTGISYGTKFNIDDGTNDSPTSDDGRGNESSSLSSSATLLYTAQTTVIGSLVYVLYHVVFCLAFASAVIREHNDEKILSPLAKMGALAIFTGGLTGVACLGTMYPSSYPTIDLFIVPFLAHMGVVVDESLYEQGVRDDDSMVFLTTLNVLCALSVVLAGAICVLGSVFRLANVGAFLPYPVLCGFFFRRGGGVVHVGVQCRQQWVEGGAGVDEW